MSSIVVGIEKIVLQFIVLKETVPDTLYWEENGK